MRRWVALSFCLCACGDPQQASLVLYDSAGAAPAGQLGDLGPRQIDGATSAWHEHRLQVGPRGNEVPLLVRWETIRSGGCDRVLRTRVERTGGSTGTRVNVTAAARPSPERCVTLLNGEPGQTPYQERSVKVDWTGRSGIRSYDSRGHMITVEGSGRADGTDQILD